MNRETTLRAAAVTFVASLLLALTPLAAHAVTSWGSTSYPPTTLGYSHTAKSGVDNTATFLEGKTQITSSPSAPSGWMGVNCRIFQSSNGALKVDTGYSFTSTTTNFYQLGCFYSATHGTFYSYGVTALYNGSGNTYAYTFRSPDRAW